MEKQLYQLEYSLKDTFFQIIYVLFFCFPEYIYKLYSGWPWHPYSYVRLGNQDLLKKEHKNSDDDIN